jgi:hypothetical protein
MRSLIVAFCVSLALMLVAGVGADAGGKGEPKYTIKEVMKNAHKSGLFKKVAAGMGDKKDAEQLLELYTALAQNKSPNDEAADWKERTTAMVAAAKLAVEGSEKAGAALKKAVNCNGCHGTHK